MGRAPTTLFSWGGFSRENLTAALAQNVADDATHQTWRRIRHLPNSPILSAARAVYLHAESQVAFVSPGMLAV